MSWLFKDKQTILYVKERKTFPRDQQLYQIRVYEDYTEIMCSVNWMVDRIVTKQVLGIVKFDGKEV